MVRHIRSRRGKTRHKYKLHYRQRGKVPLSRYFQSFNAGDVVGLKINSSVEKGHFFRRFYGMSGKITGVKKGVCYEVSIYDGDKAKTLYVHPIHLQKQGA